MKTILHIVNTGHLASQFTNNLLELMTGTDAILFIEDGVYNTLSTAENQALLDKTSAKLFVLMPDLQARGFERQGILDAVNAVDYDGFVDLTAQFDVSMSW